MSRSVCNNCLVERESGLKKCAGCKYVYYCGRDCQRESWRDIHKGECLYLRAIAPKVPTDTVRLIARIIIKLRSGGSKIVGGLPDGSKRRFDDLMTHRKEIVRDHNRMRAFDSFFDVLKECFRGDLGGVPPKAEVLDVYGRVLVNSFNIMNAEFQSVGIGLYLEASALDHSCRPSATVSFAGKEARVRQTRDGPKLDFADVRISYCSLLSTREKRQKDLREQYYFDCTCEECSEGDNAKEALKAAALRCSGCPSAVPMRRAGEVSCPQCKAVVSPSRAKDFWKAKDKVVDAVFKNMGKHPEPMEQSGDFLDSMRGLFHPADRHYLDLVEHNFEVAMREVSLHFPFCQSLSVCLFIVYVKSQISWKSALSLGREILSAYDALYPAHDVNTALMLIKVAKLENYLEETAEALDHITRGLKELSVCYGSDHPFVEVGFSFAGCVDVLSNLVHSQNTVLRLKHDIESEMNVKKLNQGDKLNQSG